MIDIHSHILPGLDDGPQSMEEALRMCHIASADGIRTIVATPHYKPGSYDWNAASLQTILTALQEEVRAAGLDLTLLPGAETPLSPELSTLLLMDGKFLTLNCSSYFLVEFSPHAVPVNTESFLQSLMLAGLVPVIAHPERSSWFMHQPESLSRLVAQGALLQLTAGSILGQFGPEVRNFSQHLISGGLAHVIASDAHDAGDRSPLLSEAVSLVADLTGLERARAMVTSTPAAIISGQRLQLPAADYFHHPRPTRSRSWMQRLLGRAA